jgi:hypothetical protein
MPWRDADRAALRAAQAGEINHGSPMTRQPAGERGRTYPTPPPAPYTSCYPTTEEDVETTHDAANRRRRPAGRLMQPGRVAAPGDAGAAAISSLPPCAFCARRLADRATWAMTGAKRPAKETKLRRLLKSLLFHVKQAGEANFRARARLSSAAATWRSDLLGPQLPASGFLPGKPGPASRRDVARMQAPSAVDGGARPLHGRSSPGRFAA